MWTTNKSMAEKRTTREEKEEHLPMFCDFSCPHAGFAQPDAVGACRKDIAVYCSLYKKHNNKNSNCLGRK